MDKGIEQGVHYSPVIPYDVDKDGKTEVYCKNAEDAKGAWPNKVTSGAEWLVKLDPATGKPVKKAAWPPRKGSYNNDSRNYITVAYLDGKNPSVIAARGTYGALQVWAYDKELNIKWKWSSGGSKGYNGAGAHFAFGADVDDDGRDEVVFGAAIIDDNGKGLRSIGGHADMCYVGDMDWSNPGTEIFYGRGESARGAGLVDGKSGKWLWKKNDVQIDGQGLVADLNTDIPGLEAWGKDQKNKQKSVGGYCWDTEGRSLKCDVPGHRGGVASLAAYWDGTEQASIIGKGAPTGNPWRTMVADIKGDWREEILWGEGNAIHVCQAKGKASFSRPSLMVDRLYRITVAKGVFLCGYLQRPMMSTRLAARKHTSMVISPIQKNAAGFRESFSGYDLKGSQIEFSPYPENLPPAWIFRAH